MPLYNPPSIPGLTTSGGVVTIATESTSNLLVLESTTDGDATDANPELVFKSASDDNGDYIGSILFQGKNAGGTYDTYAQMYSRIDTTTESQTAGGLFFTIKHQNANKTWLWMEGHPTGTGSFTINYNAANVMTSIFTGTSTVRIYQDGTAKNLNSGLRLYQRTEAADMDGTGTSFDFMLRETTSQSDKTAGRIGIIAEQDWTSTASTQDASMVFYTIGDGSSTEKMRITSAGNVGMGTITPGANLEVNAASSPTIRIREGTDGGYLDLVGFEGTQSLIKHTSTVASQNAMLDIDVVSVDSQSQNLRFFRNSNASATGFVQIHEPGASTVKAIIAADTGKVAIGSGTTSNQLTVNHTGADGSNGIIVLREDTSTADGDLLGGIGFDSTDGNVPSSILEASAFIASIATEDHGTGDKGGNLKFGVSLIDEDDDTVSTILANVGPPDTTANATTHPGLNSRATTAIVAAATYAPTIEDTGTLVIFSHANSNLTLPSINNTTTVGVQFTVFNNTGSAISAQIAVSNSATINGAAATSNDDIASYKAATFIATGNNTWARIG